MSISVAWKPQKGPQTWLLSCPVGEIFFGGARGGGKTDGLLGDFVAHVGRWGSGVRGVLFRRTYRELEEVLDAARRILVPLGADYKVARWTFLLPNGAELKLRYLRRDADSDSYQGHQYNWMGFDEVTNWPSSRALDKLRACLRSALGIRCRLVLSGNPGGPGHNWVKARYVDPAPPLKLYRDSEDQQCVYIPSRLTDNPLLLDNDPGYVSRLKQSGPEWLVKAWLDGTWDIVAGGMFDDVWSSANVLPRFEIPSSWQVDRSFDWGSTRPFSVGWWAESDGTPALIGGVERHLPRGSVVRIAEWYGSTGKPNEGVRMTANDVAREILQREKGFGFGVIPGPADNSIHSVENGQSIAEDMAAQGVFWERSDKSAGSRKLGWERIRMMFKNAAGSEEPGLFVCENCRDFIRTVPTLARDERDQDDVDRNAEDHIADESRYRLMALRNEIRVMKLSGL
jgi:hypothetical protein